MCRPHEKTLGTRCVRYSMITIRFFGRSDRRHRRSVFGDRGDQLRHVGLRRRRHDLRARRRGPGVPRARGRGDVGDR